MQDQPEALQFKGDGPWVRAVGDLVVQVTGGAPPEGVVEVERQRPAVQVE